jgi:hypothetical protein
VDIAELERIVREAPRDELPRLLGAVVTVEAHIRMRIVESPAAATVAANKFIDGDEMASIAGTSKRDILQKTRGLSFRCDLSRKRPRAVEAEFIRWYANRKKRR